MSQGAVWALVSAVDHLHALRKLIIEAHTVPARAPFTLLRAALENAAIAIWLLAPDDRAKRVLRRLRLQWANIKNDESARQLIDHAQTRPTKDQKRQLQDIGRAAGLSPAQVSTIAANPVSYSTIVETADKESIHLEGDLTPLVWKLCSGIAHVQPWAVMAVLERSGITRIAENVLNVRLTASDTMMQSMTGLTAVAVHDSWRLFDQQITHDPG